MPPHHLLYTCVMPAGLNGIENTCYEFGDFCKVLFVQDFSSSFTCGKMTIGTILQLEEGDNLWEVFSPNIKRFEF